VLHTLEELEVRDCDSLEAVFDVKGMKSQEILIKQSTQLKRLTLSNLPKMKHICVDFGQLEMLEIESCGVRVIVSMEETGSMEINFNFPQLKVMKLYHLTNLKSFYQGKHTLDCPSLKTLNVYRCEALRMFSFDNSDLQQPYSVEENQDMLFQQPLFCIEKVNSALPCFFFICMYNNTLVFIFIMGVYFSVEPQPGGIGSKWHRYVGDIEWLLSRKYLS